jgi:hypothetical protein
LRYHFGELRGVFLLKSSVMGQQSLRAFLN